MCLCSKDYTFKVMNEINDFCQTVTLDSVDIINKINSIYIYIYTMIRLFTKQYYIFNKNIPIQYN